MAHASAHHARLETPGETNAVAAPSDIDKVSERGPRVFEPAPAHTRTLRDWLAYLSATDRLVTMDAPVSLHHTLAAAAKRLDGKQAALFLTPLDDTPASQYSNADTPGRANDKRKNRSAGTGLRHTVPVVSGFMSQRAWIAEAMGVPQSGLLERFQQATDAPLPSRHVSRDEAPCQQVVITRDIDLHALLPIPTHSEHDNGPYITAGLVIARNPRTGVQNVSINRIQVHAADRMAILLLPRHLHAFHRIAEEAGDALDIAVVIGVDPLTMLASQAITPIDRDELEIAGALHGAPLPVVRCVTNNVDVPASAEIVIEGRLLPGVREPEGPFGEFPKYYSARESREVIQVDAVTHRRQPVFHTIVPAEMEHLLLGAIPREATLLGMLRRSHPGVVDVHLSVGGVCRYHLWVQMAKRREGEAKNVILCAFGAHYDIKQVVVVDTDVDVHDASEIEWAIATRFQADRDLVIVSGAQGSLLDPSTTVESARYGIELPPEMQGMSAKMGIDATRPVHYREHVFTRVRIPGQDDASLDALATADAGRLARYLAADNAHRAESGERAIGPER